ncbi:hypothetical protein [Lutimaribacter saemankumensis]|nr:hypothetical protein [Lutimaribacter saemankumensis]
MDFFKKLAFPICAAVGLFAAASADASTCSVSGATITKIGSTNVAPALAATACEDYAGNIGAGSTFIDGLNAGTFFTGEFAAGTTWTFVGKEDSSTDDPDITAQIGNTIGTWSADFDSLLVNNVIIALKGTQNGALFLFKGLNPSASYFEGGFDMTLAGLIAGGSGGGGGLSNLSVAGVYVSDPPGGVIPLPAGLPLLLSAIGIGGLISRRKRKTA